VVVVDVAGLARGVRRGCRAYRRQYSVGEAYERIGVDGKHVVLAIGVSCRQWGHAHRNRHRDEIVLLTASETAPT
jgi:hypothetical protein